MPGSVILCRQEAQPVVAKPANSKAIPIAGTKPGPGVLRARPELNSTAASLLPAKRMERYFIALCLRVDRAAASERARAVAWPAAARQRWARRHCWAREPV